MTKIISLAEKRKNSLLDFIPEAKGNAELINFSKALPLALERTVYALEKELQAVVQNSMDFIDEELEDFYGRNKGTIFHMAYLVECCDDLSKFVKFELSSRILGMHANMEHFYRSPLARRHGK